MAEYKNGVNAFGNMSVSKEDRSAEVETGRAVFVDEDKYANDPDYKLKVDKCLAEGFHRVGGGGGGSSDFSTAKVTFTAAAGTYTIPNIYEDGAVTTIVPTYTLEEEEGTSTLTVPLYKGKCGATFDGCNVSVSGNARVDAHDVLITGDCAITVRRST